MLRNANETVEHAADELQSPAKTGGPRPFPVLGIAFAAGVAIAKWIDWRGHAHPKR